MDVFAVTLPEDAPSTNIWAKMPRGKDGKYIKDNEKSIIFNRADESLQVKISRDLTQVILVNNYEGYILSKTSSDDKYIINKLS